MNSRERILVALGNKQPDRVPIFELLINESSILRLAKILIPEKTKIKGEKTRLGEKRNKILDLYCSIIEILNIDSTTTDFSTGFKIIDENTGIDKFGIKYRLSKYGEPFPMNSVVNNLKDCKNLDMASKLKSSDFSDVEYMLSKFGKSKAHFLNILDPYKLSWRLRGGMQNLLLDYVLNPELIHKLAEITTEYDMAAMDIAQKIGVDIFVMPGDLAGEETTMMSPIHYRGYIKPYQKILVKHAHKLGLKIVKHSDGNIWPILDDFIEVGFDGIHPIQPQCMDIKQVKEYVKGKVCILGNIDCRNLLPFGSQKEVEKTVKETIRVASSGGGYIISSSNSIHSNVKPENYIAMIEAVHKYGLYEST